MSGWIGALGLLLLPLAGQATTITYTISGNGLDDGYACTTGLTCPNASASNLKFAHVDPASGFDAATGTITIDDVGNTIVLDIFVASSTFEDTAVAVNGVDEIAFTDLHYTGTISGVTISSPGGNTLYSWTAQNVGGVEGDYEQLLLGGNVLGPGPFSKSGVRLGGSCLLEPVSGVLTCGFDFGGGPSAMNTFTLPIGTGTPVNAKFLHRLDPRAVPEPGTLGLFGIGLVGLAFAGLRRA